MIALTSAANAAPAFDRIVVFGDSLSDSGNAGRFSNGPVWVEHLAAGLGLPLGPARLGGGNFAVGGARLDPRSGPFGLRAQADLFLGMPPRGRTLHVVFGGGNDLLAAVGAYGAEQAVDTAAATLKGIVADLVRRGASDILVPNLPDVGMTPQMRARGPRAMAEARDLSRRFNTAVGRALAGFGDGVRLYRLDVWSMAEQVRAAPASFGFTDVMTPCSGFADCAGYVFWDHIHPTTAAHARMAQAARRLLAGEAEAP